MPFKKKTYRKKKKKYAVVRQPQIIADSTIVTLRYVDSVNLNAGAATRAYDTWSATSIFDPYVAVGGHQPLGADQWAQFYNHYQVIGAKITAHFTVISTGTVDNTIGVVKLSDTSTWTPTDINTLMEQNKVNYKFLTSGNGSRSYAKVVGYYSPRKFFGLKYPSDEHDLRGTTGDSGTDPTENAYFHVGLGSANDGDPMLVPVRVVIEYRVKFTERKDIGAS